MATASSRAGMIGKLLMCFTAAAGDADSSLPAPPPAPVVVAEPRPLVAIIGASGLVGQYVTPGFLQHGQWDVRLLTRKGGAAKLSEFASQGAQVVEVDFGSPADLTAALRGVHTVVSVVGSQGLASQVEVIKAAKEAGVTRFVPSEFGLDSGAPGFREYFAGRADKYAARDAVEASGMEWTYVVTGFFLESTFIPSFHWDVPGGKVTLKGKTDTPFTVTSLVDVGRWLPALLLDPKSRNATVYLKGEETNMEQALQAVSKASAKQLEVTRRSAAELAADIAAAPAVSAAFYDLRLRAIADGWGNVPEGKQWNADAPTVTLAQHFAAIA